MIAIGLFLSARWAQGSFAQHKPDMVPVAALDRAIALHTATEKEQGRSAVIFHAYSWGGYLVWHGWPNVRDWIDDRNEVQGEEHIRHYFTIIEAAVGWRERLAGADIVAVPPDVPLVQHLRSDRDWCEVFADPFAVIFRRSSNRVDGHVSAP